MTESRSDAYLAILPTLPKRQAEMYELLELAGVDGLIYDEAELHTGNLRESNRRMISNLRDAGLAKDSGRSRTGKYGFEQTVWVLGDDRAVLNEGRAETVARTLRKLPRDIALAVIKDYLRERTA